MTLTISDDDARDYVRQGGVSCPACGSEDIEGDGYESDAHYVAQPMECHDCRAKWTDVYSLAYIEIVIRPAQDEPDIRELGKPVPMQPVNNGDVATLKVTRPEFNMILAALRYFQHQGMGEAASRPAWLQGIACPTDDSAGLDARSIDDLCERIEYGG
jgi:hypothetical protein